MNIDNIILNTDSYKASHWLQYPPNTTSVLSYIEARGGEYAEAVFYGLQIFLKEYLTKPITQEMIDEAGAFFEAHGEPFNRDGWEYILDEHGGFLPLKIRAVPEGTIVPIKNVMTTIENTDPKCFWLTSYVETAYLRAVWYPLTVATKSREIKKVIKRYLVETADEAALEGLAFKLHDFGARGVSSKESAGIGGSAHIVNFMGTDTITGALYAMHYYNENVVPAFSVPAAEHSSITTWLKDGELEAYKNMLEKFGGKFPIVSVVSDSYDIYNAVENMWGGELKDMVIESGSTLVVRPDSGDPAEVVAKVAMLLDATFGSEVNSKGYKVLNHTRILQGDGLSSLEDFENILSRLKGYGFSTDNVVFGMGGGLLQQVNRDTMQFAMKACSAFIDGEEVDVFKDPVTDSGKWSKRGRLELYRTETGELVTGLEGEELGEVVMETVFLDGELVKDINFSEVRANAA